MKKLITIFFILLAMAPVIKADKSHAKRMYMWFDCEENFKRLSTPDSITLYLEKLNNLGFTDVVVDVKSIMGETLFRSEYATYMSEWNGFTRDNGYDLLGEFIKLARPFGIKVHASLNVFSGGHNFYDRGIIYNDHAAWQSQNYLPGGIVPISSIKTNYNGMLNPALPEVREYELNIIKELVKNYPDMDGIVLDRARYDGITSDFSQESLQMFEKYAGVTVNRFPEDIFSWTIGCNKQDSINKGKYFNLWIEWRASVIFSFFREVRTEIKKINPKIEFSDYTGSWYPLYFEVGANWASKKYNPSKEYDWATARYKYFGYAEILDTYMSGLYYYEVTKEEITIANNESIKGRKESGLGTTREYWYSVEGAAEIAEKVTMGRVPLYGSLYVYQYKDNAAQFESALKMALDKTDGVMLYDIGNIIDQRWWNVLEEALNEINPGNGNKKN